MVSFSVFLTPATFSGYIGIVIDKLRQFWLPIGALVLIPAAVVWGQDRAPRPVVVQEASVGEGGSVLELSGSFVARRSATLSTELAGLVKDIHVELGDQVTSGDPLLTLDDTLARLSLARLQAAVRQAEVEAADAKRVASETAELLTSGAFPATVVETNQARAEATVAALASQRAAAAEQSERVDRHVLRAPFSGIVANRVAEQGEWITPGAPTFELVNTEELWLEVELPQDRFNALDPNQAVQLRGDAGPGQVVIGRIDAVVPVGDPETRTMTVRVGVDNKDHQFVPGMSGRAAFSMNNAGAALRISRDALVRRPDGSNGVWIVREEAGQLKAEAARVDVGRTLGELVEVKSGLSAGDRVVVRGNESLIDGQAVRLVTPTGIAVSD